MMNKLLKKIAMALFVTAAFLSASDVTAQKYFMYVGTYTTWKEGGKGIYLYRFNTQDGQITYEGVTTGIRNPFFLAQGCPLIVNGIPNPAGFLAGAGLSAIFLRRRS